MGGRAGRSLLGASRLRRAVPPLPAQADRPRLARLGGRASGAAAGSRPRLAGPPRVAPLRPGRPPAACLSDGAAGLGVRLPRRGRPGGRATAVAGPRAGALPAPLLAAAG